MLPEDSQITIEAAVPEPVAQNHDAILARNEIGWSEETSASRRHAQRREEFGRDQGRRDSLRTMFLVVEPVILPRVQFGPIILPQIH
jgi:hypothetical protein